MKRLLLLLLVSTTIISCKESVNKPTLTEAEKNSIETFFKTFHEDRGEKFVSIDYLDKKKITSKNIDDIRNGILAYVEIMMELKFNNAPTHSVISKYNSSFNISNPDIDVANEKTLGHVFLTKVIFLNEKGIKDYNLFPIFLNNRSEVTFVTELDIDN